MCNLGKWKKGFGKLVMIMDDYEVARTKELVGQLMTVHEGKGILVIFLIGYIYVFGCIYISFCMMDIVRLGDMN